MLPVNAELSPMFAKKPSNGTKPARAITPKSVVSHKSLLELRPDVLSSCSFSVAVITEPELKKSRAL